MIRTHKPTGHHWTCASQFQQSKQYRNLDAEDWEAPPARTLVADPEDGLPVSSRVTKRRKVEKLANGFLQGRPLFISSACANGPDLTATVEKVLHEKRLGWDGLLDDCDEDLWADGDDGWAVLRKRSQERASRRSSRSRTRVSRRSTRSHVTESPQSAMAAPPPQRNSATLRAMISMAPSNDALARAAELRARKGTLTAKTTERPQQPLPSTAYVTHSAPPTARATSSFRQCSSSRPFNPNTPAETTMADELRLSRTDSPSHRPRAFTVPVESFSSDTTVEDPPLQNGDNGDSHVDDDGSHMLTSTSNPTATDSSAMELCTALQHIPSSRVAQQEPEGVVSSSKHDATSHVRHSAPTSTAFSSWTPINSKVVQQTSNTETPQIDEGKRNANQRSSERSSSKSTSKVAKTPPTRSGAKATAVGSTTSSRGQAKEASQQSTGPTTTPSNQSRLTGSFKANKPDYTLAAKSQSGGTPFVYRRKTRASKDVASRASEPPCADDGLSNSRQGDATPKPTNPGQLAATSTAPPTLTTSFLYDSSLAPAPNTSLVDEHMNRRLPNSPSSARRSSSVEKALRSEMRLSGADLSRVPNDPASSQPDESPNDSSANNATDRHTASDVRRESLEKRRSTGQWPGTQILLNRAQHDLFMSPNKLGLAPAVEKSGVQEQGEDLSEVHDPEDTRQPLRQLSQERLPATQALMDTWSPWSTTKKPRTQKRTSFAPSPLLAKEKATPTGSSERSLRSSMKRAPPSDRIKETAPRRSSLRFSTVTAEAPVPQHRNPTVTPASVGTIITNTHLPSPSLDRESPPHGADMPNTTSPYINLDFTTFSFADATSAAQDDDSTVADVSFREKLSSFQNAQDPYPDETTVLDFARDFLSTADVDAA